MNITNETNFVHNASNSSFDVQYDPDAYLRLVKDISYLYISPIIISVGIFGDLMNVLVLSHPVLRKTSVVYSYLLALSVTDLLAHCSVIPMLLWILGYRLCTKTAAFYYAHFGFPLANAFMGASVWIVVFITLGQYIAVCHPFVQTFRSKRICIVATLCAYAFSFTAYFPWMWKKRVLDNTMRNHHCEYTAIDNFEIINTVWFHAYQLTRESFSRFVPFIFIVYFNVRIMFVYRRSKTQRLNVVGQHQKLNLQQRTEREERRLWYLLLAVMTVFFVCTLPAAVFTILVNDKYEKNLPFQIIRSISNILEFMKFALNFYLYCMINPDIRRLFVKRCAPIITIFTYFYVTIYRYFCYRIFHKHVIKNYRNHRKRKTDKNISSNNSASSTDNNSNYSYTLCSNGAGIGADPVSGYYSFRNNNRKPAILKGSRQTLAGLLMDEDNATNKIHYNKSVKSTKQQSPLPIIKTDNVTLTLPIRKTSDQALPDSKIPDQMLSPRKTSDQLLSGRKISNQSLSVKCTSDLTLSEQKISDSVKNTRLKNKSQNIGACRKTVSFKDNLPSLIVEECSDKSANSKIIYEIDSSKKCPDKLGAYHYNRRLSRSMYCNTKHLSVTNNGNGSEKDELFFGFYETKV